MKILRRFLSKLIMWFLILSIGGVLLFRFVPVYFTPLMGIRAVQSLVQGELPQFHHRWVSYNHISDHLKRAVIAAEDQRFFLHHGFDRVEIEKPFARTKPVSGLAEQAPSLNKQRRIFFSGPVPPGLGKGWRHILLCSSNCYGQRNVFWRFISTAWRREMEFMVQKLLLVFILIPPPRLCLHPNRR